MSFVIIQFNFHISCKDLLKKSQQPVMTHLFVKSRYFFSFCFYKATIWLILILLHSSTEPLPVSVPAWWWKRWRPSASVQHSHPGVWQQHCSQPDPPSTTTNQLRFPDVQRPGQRSSYSGQKHCDCRSRCPPRRQQLLIRGRCFLQLGCKKRSLDGNL